MLPAIDQAFDLTPEGARSLTSVAPPRVEPDKVGHLDWHNDVSRLVLDIDAALAAAADDKARSVLVRRSAGRWKKARCAAAKSVEEMRRVEPRISGAASSAPRARRRTR